MGYDGGEEKRGDRWQRPDAYFRAQPVVLLHVLKGLVDVSEDLARAFHQRFTSFREDCLATHAMK